MSLFIKSVWFQSIVAGLLLALSFIPFQLPILLLPAFFILFMMSEKADSGTQLAYWSYPAFFIWNLISTYWLMMATVAGGIAAISANAVIMTIPIALMRKAHLSSFPNFIKFLTIPSIWTTYEFLHFRWDLSWPWLSLGNAFGDYPFLVQFIEFTGQLGITWLVVFFAYALYRFFQHLEFFKSKSNLSKKTTNLGLKICFISSAILLVGILIVDFFLWKKNQQFDAYPQAEIVVIQPNYDSYLPDAGFTNMYLAQQNLLSLADSSRTEQTKLILFPENSIQPIMKLDGLFARQLQDSAQMWNLTLVSGLTEMVSYSEEAAPPVFRGVNNNQPYDFFNSAFIWEPDGTITSYRKHNLVPIVERIPFVEFLAALDFFHWIDWGNIAGYGKGNTIMNAHFEGGAASVLICYDSVFPDWSRRYNLKGANLIGIITNDGWWGNSPGHKQHFSFGRLRAIEARKSIARSANNGISGFILPNGKILAQSNYWERTYLRASIPLPETQTFYVKYGDIIGWISLILSFLGISALLIKKK